MTTHVVILGLMGAGKTSVGRRVAAALDRPLLDSDQRLEAGEGRTASQIAEAHGLARLHELERAILRESLAHPEPAVVAPAASVLDDEGCVDALRRHTVVWLAASAAQLAGKAADKDHRPLVGRGPEEDEALFARQIAEREPRVRPIAALVVDVERTAKDDAAALVVDLVRSPSSSAPPTSPPSS